MLKIPSKEAVRYSFKCPQTEKRIRAHLFILIEETNQICPGGYREADRSSTGSSVPVEHEKKRIILLLWLLDLFVSLKEKWQQLRSGNNP